CPLRRSSLAPPVLAASVFVPGLPACRARRLLDDAPVYNTHRVGFRLDAASQPGDVAHTLCGGDQALLSLGGARLVERRLVAIEGESQQALHIAEQQARGAQTVGVGCREEAGGGGATQHLGGMGIEQVGPLGSVTQREILGDEIDVEQPAFEMLEIPWA